MMNKYYEERVPNLEAIDEHQARQFLVELYTVLSAEKEYALRHEDYAMEMPQSGERIRGRENMRAFQRAFAGHCTPPSIRMRRVLVRDGLWVAEGVNDYGGRVFHSTIVYELKDGKIWRDTRYYAEPFEAPEWRARWVERMESEAPDATPVRGEQRYETNEREVQALIDGQFAKMQAGDLAGAHEWYDDAVVLEWPQSGERVLGRENLMALREAYPADVEFEVRQAIARRNLGVVELVICYDGRPVNDRHLRVRGRQGSQGNALLRGTFPASGVEIAVGREDGGVMTVQTEIIKPDGNLLAERTLGHVKRLGPRLVFPGSLGGAPCES